LPTTQAVAIRGYREADKKRREGKEFKQTLSSLNDPLEVGDEVWG
jgi:hypothetical protein